MSNKFVVGALTVVAAIAAIGVLNRFPTIGVKILGK